MIDPILQKLIDANIRFGFKLLAELLKENGGKNIFISPVSIAMAIAIIYNGADGETRSQMQQALELQGLTVDEVNHGYATLNTMLPSVKNEVWSIEEINQARELIQAMPILETKEGHLLSEKHDKEEAILAFGKEYFEKWIEAQGILSEISKEFQLAIANSLWLKQDKSFEKAFWETVSASYGAEMFNIEFSDAAVATVNNWIQEKTQRLIPRVIDTFDPLTTLLIINAIYFKGFWAIPFDLVPTKHEAFTCSDGTSVLIPMMCQITFYSYYETDKFQAISVPYHNEVSMYVFLPHKKARLEDFLTSLNSQNWNTWLNRFRRQRGELGLPKFQLSTEIHNLIPFLKRLGVTLAFDSSGADFHKIAREIFISQIIHKTKITVDEEGTEAAAVTVIETEDWGEGPEDIREFHMIVDRPFFFAIQDNSTGAILFMGTVTDPTN